MLGLGWRYRWGCLQLLTLQALLLGTALAALGLTGLGIDVVRYYSGRTTDLPAYPWGWQWVLGFFIPTQPGGPVGGMSPLAQVAVIAGAVLVVSLTRAILNFIYTVASGKFVHRQIVVDLRSEVYDKLQRLSFRFFDANATGSIINRVTSDVQSVRAFIDGVLIQAVILLLSLVCYLAYMIHLHPLLTLVCLATTPILWILTIVFSRVVRPAYDRARELADDMVRTLAENIQGVHVVKGFAREREEIEKFHKATDAVRQQERQIFWKVSLFTPAIGLLTQINLVVLLGYGGWLVTQNQLPLGTGLVVFAGLLQQFSSQVANMTNIANSVQQSLSGARRVFEVLDAHVEVRSPEHAVPLLRARGAVRFEQVSFEYVPGLPVLQEIDFEVQPGQRVAILGATGAGKSTLMSLIPRFYDPTAGRVLIDGLDLRTLNLDDLRRNIGLVFQESFLFSNTIAANIAFGHPHATREQVERAAKIAAAHEFIAQMPEGYDTILGEYGMDLSGGQRQRLAIARAVLLDPAILLLDDPAAAIDPHTEQEILHSMRQAMTGRTTLIIAHRLSTLREADLVIVLEQGRISQIGTHADLLEAPGHYRDAARVQLSAGDGLLLGARE